MIKCAPKNLETTLNKVNSTIFAPVLDMVANIHANKNINRHVMGKIDDYLH